MSRERKRALGVATDLGYGTPLIPAVELRDGDHADLAGCGVAVITAGVNEKAGRAAARKDPKARLRLLDTNAIATRR